jgi:predicted RNA-binding Zn ribbon-like protein
VIVDDERERRLRFDSGAVWLDLVATVGFARTPAPIERLRDLDRLREWLAAQNLLPAAELTEADLDLAKDLRQTLRGLAESTVEEKSPSGDVIAQLNEFLAADGPVSVRVTRSGELTVNRPATVAEALARIARQAVEHLTGPVAATLRKCADEDCSMVFTDPNGRRRWCAAETCGVRNRVRAHRERQRST